jgi:hypothetical protein
VAADLSDPGFREARMNNEVIEPLFSNSEKLLNSAISELPLSRLFCFVGGRVLGFFEGPFTPIGIELRSHWNNAAPSKNSRRLKT